jgi:hypothetical protein
MAKRALLCAIAAIACAFLAPTEAFGVPRPPMIFTASVDPSTNVVTITGSDFFMPTVTIGGVAATVLPGSTSSTIFATTGTVLSGSEAVVVTNNNGQSGEIDLTNVPNQITGSIGAGAPGAVAVWTGGGTIGAAADVSILANQFVVGTAVTPLGKFTVSTAPPESFLYAIEASNGLVPGWGLVAQGESSTPDQIDGGGVLGQSVGGVGVRGTSSSGSGVDGESTTEIGVLGQTSSKETFGVVGTGPFGGTAGFSEAGFALFGFTTSGVGLVAESRTGDGVRGTTLLPDSGGAAIHGLGFQNALAGLFEGDVLVKGNFSATGTKSFQIDHPLDPANRYLVHSCVESPDRKNIYDGVATLDPSGAATVELPAYFEALNKDFRYQLTAIGAPAPGLYVAEEIAKNRFRIAGGKPGLKVSWQVTGTRKDAHANAHPMVVEAEKPASERGLYLDPAAFGEPAEKGIGFASRARLAGGPAQAGSK